MSDHVKPKEFTCPVCGYPRLTEPAYDRFGNSSFDICPSCWVEFGCDDHGFSHRNLRYRWIMNGAKWHSTATAPPPGWSAGEQLKAAGMHPDQVGHYALMRSEPPPSFDAIMAALKNWLRPWAPGIDGYRLMYSNEHSEGMGKYETSLRADTLLDIDSLREFFDRLLNEGRAWIEIRGCGRVRGDEYWLAIDYSRVTGSRGTQIAFIGPPLDPLVISIEATISAAVDELVLSPDLFYRCDETTAQNVVRETKARFVEDHPGVWWFSLKHKVLTKHFPDGGFRHLQEYVPHQEETCWLIPELHEKSALVYGAQVSCLMDVLGNTDYPFEYYLVGKNLDWLIAESDADQLIVSALPKARPNSDG